VSKWRPGDWDKTKAIAFGEIGEDVDYVGFLFEAGADAMLEALRKNHRSFSPRRVLAQQRTDLGYLTTQTNGILVFIPDEE
jgi:hypothetical protein